MADDTQKSGLERHAQSIGVALVLMGIAWLVATSSENKQSLAVLSVQYKALDEKFTQRFAGMDTKVQDLLRKVDDATPGTVKLQSMADRLERVVGRLHDHMNEPSHRDHNKVDHK